MFLQLQTAYYHISSSNHTWTAMSNAKGNAKASLGVFFYYQNLQVWLIFLAYQYLPWNMYSEIAQKSQLTELAVKSC